MIGPLRTRRSHIVGLLALVLGGLAGSSTMDAAAARHADRDTRSAGATLATALAVDQPRGTVFVVSGTFDNQTGGATARGTLTVLAAGHHALRRIRAVAVGYGPSSVVVDELTRRVLVLNAGGGDKYAGFAGGSVTVLDLMALEGPASANTFVVRTTALGRQLPRALALDHLTGHALVANWVKTGPGSFTQIPGGSVSMIDSRTGSAVHTTHLAIAAEAVAVDDAAGHAFVLPGMQGASAALSMLDTHTGALLRSIRTMTGGQALAIDSHTGRLFIPTSSGSRSAVQVRATSDGALINTVLTSGGPVAFAVDEPRGRVFMQLIPESATQGRGIVNMLDAGDGTLRGTARAGFPALFMHALLGGTPQTLAVDGMSGHLLVANGPKTDANGMPGSDGSVSIFEAKAHALQLVRTVAVAGLPVALATDFTGHAYVITTSTMGHGAAQSQVIVLDAGTGIITGAVSL